MHLNHSSSVKCGPFSEGMGNTDQMQALVSHGLALASGRGTEWYLVSYSGSSDSIPWVWEGSLGCSERKFPEVEWFVWKVKVARSEISWALAVVMHVGRCWNHPNHNQRGQDDQSPLDWIRFPATIQQGADIWTDCRSCTTATAGTWATGIMMLLSIAWMINHNWGYWCIQRLCITVP